MFQQNRHLLRTCIALTAAGLASVLLAGCNEYLERRDTISLSAGDAIAANKAVQTINRWPDAARQDRWLSDGERARIAESRYRRRAVPSPKSLDKSGGNSDMEADMQDKAGGSATTGK
jgi:hypothetical protein